MIGIKNAVKKSVPDFILDARKHRKRMRLIEEHKRMNRPEIEAYLTQRYAQRIGAELDLENPKRFTEKIQWCKLNAMDATKSMLADKYVVRDWVSSMIGEDYLMPLLGAWDSPADIDFDALPNSFVLKTNNASGTNIIVPNKASFSRSRVRSQLKRWLQEDFGWVHFEPQYLSISPKIIAERFICNEDGSEINDYKVLCFDGEPRFVWVDIDRHTRHSRVVFDTEWNVQPWNQYHYPEALSIPDKPGALEEMIGLARELARGFAQVRVDFYVVDGRPLFGEMTFTDGAGFEEIRPDEWDFKLGEMWDLAKEPHAEFPPNRNGVA